MWLKDTLRDHPAALRYPSNGGELNPRQLKNEWKLNQRADTIVIAGKRSAAWQSRKNNAGIQEKSAGLKDPIPACAGMTKIPA